MAGGSQEKDETWPVNRLLEEDYWRKHPGVGESLVPFWGSAREAVADGFEGDVGGAILNGGMALSDAFLAGAFAKGLIKTGGKGLIYIGGKELKDPYAWRRVRKWMTDNNFAEKGQHVHHWLFEQNRGIGKYIPKIVKNQPWNGNPMRTPEIHGRLDHRYLTKARFDPARRYWYGTPHWAKAAQAGIVGHPTGYVKSQLEDEE